MEGRRTRTSRSTYRVADHEDAIRESPVERTHVPLDRAFRPEGTGVDRVRPNRADCQGT